MPGFPFMHWSKSCVIFMNFWWLHLSQLGTSALSWELWRLMDGNVYPESSWDLSILSGARTNGREANVPTGSGVQFSSCKFLQERGGLVNQLHLLHDCLVGTHTHICIRIHICVHIPIWMYQHTYTHRHTQLDMGTGLSDCSASLEVAEVRGECYALLSLLTRKRGTFHCRELQHKMVYAFMMSFFSVSQHIWKTLVLKSCYSLVSTHAWHGSSAYSSRPFDVGKKHRWR